MFSLVICLFAPFIMESFHWGKNVSAFHVRYIVYAFY